VVVVAWVVVQTFAGERSTTLGGALRNLGLFGLLCSLQ
jgi:hypothetical protein